MIYTNSTTIYTNIDTQKSVHFAGPVLTSAVWTDKKNNTKLFL